MENVPSGLSQHNTVVDRIPILHVGCVQHCIVKIFRLDQMHDIGGPVAFRKADENDIH